jgi:hypothetical protein
MPPAFIEFCAAAETEFAITIDRRRVTSVALSALASFEQARRDYRLLFARVLPRFVLLSQNGIESGLFVAAREQGIAVVEAQHGLINFGHAAYSFPPGVSGDVVGAVPSHFVTFSDYWSCACHYPAERVVALGNDDFFVRPLPPAAEPGEVLFASADIYHATLAPLLATVAARLPRRRFMYKLHPNQQSELDAIRDQFASITNITVIAGHTPARDLLANVEVVVVVQSTVVHEALQAGRRVCIVPVLNYHIHEDLFALPSVKVTPDAAALELAIETAIEPSPAPTFFNSFDDKQARALLDALFQTPHSKCGALSSPHRWERSNSP